jgi:hypothetical protein
MRRFAIPAVIAATLLLTACVPDGPTPGPTSSPTRTATSTPTATAGPTSPPTPTSTPSVEPGEPIALTCDELVTRDQMYAFNENYSLLTDWTPDGGSLAAQVQASNGLVCRWINQTSGATIDVAVAHLSEAATAAKKAELARTGSPASAFSAEGYFSGSAAQAFPGPYWLTAVSDAFGGDAGEAALIVNSAIDNLG